ncbi:hypothetical protein [Candidatus Burkholderia verschuerenii]|uniref:hypothetical protein n=1 Tax=Candidatus Burkholderia verschuerenii TaxID=242163 RepID=UPI0012EDAAA6|nr:hypothetical protein [Candidatus Burkholderia verschuerenii]
MGLDTQDVVHVLILCGEAFGLINRSSCKALFTRARVCDKAGACLPAARQEPRNSVLVLCRASTQCGMAVGRYKLPMRVLSSDEIRRDAKRR